MKLIIFTDLDGTLLDSDYSFSVAIPALNEIKAKKVPLVLCSSKTKKEIEHVRRELHNNHPFISENGGGIFIPKGYFTYQIPTFNIQMKQDEKYVILKLGADYDDLRRALAELREEGIHTKGFGDMSIREVSELTGLKHSDAKRAKERDFDEPFIFTGKSREMKRLKRIILAKGLRYTMGEFFHIMGDSDKGRAVNILKELYKKQYGDLTTIALGDSPNDIEMLQNVDCPVVVQKKDGSYNRDIIRKVRKCIKADGIGPDGWTKTVTELLKTVVL